MRKRQFIKRRISSLIRRILTISCYSLIINRPEMTTSSLIPHLPRCYVQLHNLKRRMPDRSMRQPSPRRQRLGINFSPAELERHMQSSRTVYNGYGVRYSCIFLQHPFESVHILTHRRDPARVEAVFHICPFITHNSGACRGTFSP